MKIYITGGTGFIGSWVVKKLVEQGHEIMLLVFKDENIVNKYNSVKYIEGDLQDIDFVKKTMHDFKPDYLIHLAWFGLPDYAESTCLYNFELTFTLFKTAIDIVRQGIVSTGSCWEYESRSGGLRENSKLSGKKTFQAVKNSLRFFGESFAKERFKKFYWLRLFFVYGPGQRKESLIPTIIHSIINGEKPSILTPLNAHDFIYVEDVAKAICDIIMSNSNDIVYNVGFGKSFKVKDVISIIYEKNSKKINLELYNKQDRPIEDFWADLNKIKNDVGWQPMVDIAEGIKKTYDYIINCIS